MPVLRSFMEFILYPPQKADQERLLKTVQGKTILITGASYGIGEALAYRLAACQVHLVLVARSTEKLEQIRQDIEKQGSRVSIFTANLYHEEEVDRLTEFLLNMEGGVDIFVSNAGKSIRRLLFHSLDRYHDFTRTMSINYFAPVKVILALIPMLREKQGHIINISAANVLIAPAARWAAYQASKTAFDQWLRCALPELKAKGIAVSTLYLPLVKTRMIEPTEAYRDMPTMTPESVASLICKTIIDKRKKFTPWWLFPVQGLSLFLRGTWEGINTQHIRKSFANDKGA